MAKKVGEISPDTPEGRDLSALHELAKNIRAPFLEQAIIIERLVDDIIAWHFCPSSEHLRSQFFSVILGGAEVTFSQKINILETILRLSHHKLYQKHRTLREQLTKIRVFRNRLVHAMLDTSDKFRDKKNPDRIQLIYHEDGRAKQHVVTIADVNDRLRECSAVVMILLELDEAVSQQAA